MLTNFATIRKAVRKMSNIDKMHSTSSWTNLSKRERLQITRERAKLEKNLGSIADMTRIPAALFVVDINKEKIAVAEARKLNIPIFAMVDTNTDPTLVDFAIPSNDDASKSIHLIVSLVVQAIAEGLSERRMAKEKQDVKEEVSANAENVDIKSKSDALINAEEDADKSAEKGVEPTTDGKPKRKRKTISKNN